MPAYWGQGTNLPHMKRPRSFSTAIYPQDLILRLKINHISRPSVTSLLGENTELEKSSGINQGLFEWKGTRVATGTEAQGTRPPAHLSVCTGVPLGLRTHSASPCYPEHMSPRDPPPPGLASLTGCVRLCVQGSTRTRQTDGSGRAWGARPGPRACSARQHDALALPCQRGRPCRG